MEPGSPWSHQVQVVHVHNHISGTVHGPVMQAGAVHGDAGFGYSEKRAIELQEKAVEQLSSNEPSVRLAGLLVLQRHSRESVVDHGGCGAGCDLGGVGAGACPYRGAVRALGAAGAGA